MRHFNDLFSNMEAIYNAISAEGFSKRTVDIIDNYIQQIVNGKKDLTRFNQAEHGGLCCAGEALIGAYIVCDYAKSSLAAGEDVGAGQVASPASWQIDAEQEKLVEQWAKVKGLWFPNAQEDIESEYGPMIAQGAESMVYYKGGETSVVKIRTSIYATLGRAIESIVLHNTLFRETPMTAIGFTRDKDGLFRTICTQPYIGCKRLATKEEIDHMVSQKGFRDNSNGGGVNYIGDRLHLEDMHPANVFIDTISETPICIDCIVKFIRS